MSDDLDRTDDDLIARGKAIADSGKCTPAASLNGDRFGVDGTDHSSVDHPQKPSVSDWMPNPADRPPDLDNVQVDDRPGEYDDEDSDPRPQYVDVAAFFAGTTPEPPQPVLAHRTDDHALFYPGKLNLIFGDPESGKTLLVLAACTEALCDHRRVLYVDLDQNGPEFILPLLSAFGVPTDTLADPSMFRYYDDIDTALSMLILVDECALWRPAVAVIDSIGELLPMMGANSNDADDFTRAHTQILKPLAKTGAAVLEIDHLAKNLFSRSQGPTGAAAKRRPVGGLAIKVVTRRTFIPGKGGAAELLINKDRTGGVRRHSPPGRPQSAGTFILDTADENGAIGWRVIPPLELAAMPSAAARYLDAIRDLTTDTFTVRDVAAALSGEEAVTKSQIDQARYNMDRLTENELLIAEPVRKGVAARYRLPETDPETSDGEQGDITVFSHPEEE